MMSLSGGDHPEPEPDPLKPSQAPSAALIKTYTIAIEKVQRTLSEKWLDMVAHAPLFVETYPAFFSSEERVEAKVIVEGVPHDQLIQSDSDMLIDLATKQFRGSFPIYWGVAIIATSNPLHLKIFRERSNKVFGDLTGKEDTVMFAHYLKE